MKGEEKLSIMYIRKVKFWETLNKGTEKGSLYDEK